MFSFIFSFIVFVVLLYALITYFKDNPTITPIYNAIQPLVLVVTSKLMIFSDWVSSKLKSKK
jgi:hypothetical protein